jgi:hypothetical protein
MCSKRTKVRAHFSPTMIGLVKHQCTSLSQLPSLWACKPCHIVPDNWLFHTHQNFRDHIGIWWENTLNILLSRPEFLLPIIIHGCTSVLLYKAPLSSPQWKQIGKKFLLWLWMWLCCGFYGQPSTSWSIKNLEVNGHGGSHQRKLAVGLHTARDSKSI